MITEAYIILVGLGIITANFCSYLCFRQVINVAEIEDKVCSICLEDLKTIRFICKTRCNHYFCQPCLDAWLTVKQICPMCNSDL